MSGPFLPSNPNNYSFFLNAALKCRSVGARCVSDTVSSISAGVDAVQLHQPALPSWHLLLACTS